MTRTRKAITALGIAIFASIGLALQSTAFAVADDSHLPNIGANAVEYTAGSATTTDEGHFPNPGPR